MLFEGQEWNEAEIEDRTMFNMGIISLMAFDPDQSPRLIGTGFVIQANGSSAIAITAAHNFDGVRKVLQPHERHHPTTPREFLGELKSLEIDQTRVRAVCFDGSGVDVSLISWAVWDKRADIAVFAVAHQNNDANFFKGRFLLSDSAPVIGDEVPLIGFADMETSEGLHDGSRPQEFTVKRRLVLRCGRVTDVHPRGHILCKGPCIETSIPVFPGMSGGPAARLGREGAILPFGVISSDFSADREDKNLKNTPGSSIVALLGATFGYAADGTKLAVVKLIASEILSEGQIRWGR